MREREWGKGIDSFPVDDDEMIMIMILNCEQD